MTVGEARRIDRCRSWRIDLDDATCNWFIGRPGGNGAFDDQDFLALGIHPTTGELVQAIGTGSLSSQQEQVWQVAGRTFHFDHCCESHFIVVGTAVPDLGLDILTIMQGFDCSSNLDGIAMKLIRLAADGAIEKPSYSQPKRRLSRFTIG